MRRFLIVVFLILNSFINYDNKKDKLYFDIPLETRSEALGNTGMVFGEEYGSFYLAPTSLQNENIYIQGKVNFYKIYNDNVLMSSFFLKTEAGNFSLGVHVKEVVISALANYSFQINNFYLGLGIKYDHESLIFGRIYRNYLSASIGSMYKSIIGNFSLALNNLLFKVFKDKDNILNNVNSLTPNLRIGYGKGFYLDYIFNKVQLAFEIDNLLMNSIYLNDNEKDYSLFKKVYLGIEGVKKIGEINLLLRVGIKNFFPTCGIGIEFFDAFRIEYAFTNEDRGEYQGKERKLINFFSFEMRPNNILYEKVIYK